MGKLETYQCDSPGCGQIKTKCNHWFITVTSTDVKPQWITFYPLQDNENMLTQNQPYIKVYCSRECAQKALEAFFNSLTRQDTSALEHGNLGESVDAENCRR